MKALLPGGAFGLSTVFNLSLRWTQVGASDRMSLMKEGAMVSGLQGIRKFKVSILRFKRLFNFLKPRASNGISKNEVILLMRGNPGLIRVLTFSAGEEKKSGNRNRVRSHTDRKEGVFAGHCG